jgi:hypothetical protein
MPRAKFYWFIIKSLQCYILQESKIITVQCYILQESKIITVQCYILSYTVSLYCELLLFSNGNRIGMFLYCTMLYIVLYCELIL